MNQSNRRQWALIGLALLCLMQSVAGQQRRYGPPPERRAVSASTATDKDRSPTQQVFDLAQTLMEKTDWNNLYVKMFKLLLSGLIDIVTERMFGLSLADRSEEFAESGPGQILLEKVRERVMAALRKESKSTSGSVFAGPLGSMGVVPLPIVYQRPALIRPGQTGPSQRSAALLMQPITKILGASIAAN